MIGTALLPLMKKLLPVCYSTLKVQTIFELPKNSYPLAFLSSSIQKYDMFV
ncbi:hypothetical protein L21SP5_01906 [Salinivirga cyanobacteriivorans]|uniref:Uncharacterized protein n=1 Tax=Salinivirga cyanobacteriivorans TaxID=1307839 RepID=A0A0S2HZH7_9BACT|nr:hypothetical protein L21SP5_01906 [Salinivirga cyanobacteriivorans]